MGFMRQSEAEAEGAGAKDSRVERDEDGNHHGERTGTSLGPEPEQVTARPEWPPVALQKVIWNKHLKPLVFLYDLMADVGQAVRNLPRGGLTPGFLDTWSLTF